MAARKGRMASFSRPLANSASGARRRRHWPTSLMTNSSLSRRRARGKERERERERSARAIPPRPTRRERHFASSVAAQPKHTLDSRGKTFLFLSFSLSLFLSFSLSLFLSFSLSLFLSFSPSLFLSSSLARSPIFACGRSTRRLKDPTGCLHCVGSPARLNAACRSSRAAGPRAKRASGNNAHAYRPSLRARYISLFRWLHCSPITFASPTSTTTAYSISLLLLRILIYCASGREARILHESIVAANWRLRAPAPKLLPPTRST